MVLIRVLLILLADWNLFNNQNSINLWPRLYLLSYVTSEGKKMKLEVNDLSVFNETLARKVKIVTFVDQSLQILSIGKRLLLTSISFRGNLSSLKDTLCNLIFPEQRETTFSVICSSEYEKSLSSKLYEDIL